MSKNGRDGDAQAADFAFAGEMLDFAAMEGFAVVQASGKHLREIGVGAENFAIGAITQRAHGQSFFGGGIGGTDGTGGIDQQQASGHVARDFFGEAFGFLGALLGQKVQTGELLFLRAQLFDHTLHGRSHESGGVFRAGPGRFPFFLTRAGAGENFAGDHDESDDEQGEKNE